MANSGKTAEKNPITARKKANRAPYPLKKDFTPTIRAVGTPMVIKSLTEPLARMSFVPFICATMSVTASMADSV